MDTNQDSIYSDNLKPGDLQTTSLQDQKLRSIVFSQNPRCLELIAKNLMEERRLELLESRPSVDALHEEYYLHVRTGLDESIVLMVFLEEDEENPSETAREYIRHIADQYRYNYSEGNFIPPIQIIFFANSNLTRNRQAVDEQTFILPDKNKRKSIGSLYIYYTNPDLPLNNQSKASRIIHDLKMTDPDQMFFSLLARSVRRVKTKDRRALEELAQDL